MKKSGLLSIRISAYQLCLYRIVWLDANAHSLHLGGNQFDQFTPAGDLEF